MMHIEFGDRPHLSDNHSAYGWLTAAEAAQYLRIKTRTLLLWARQGKVRGRTLPGGTTRRVWLFRQGDLDATLDPPSVRPAERMIQ